MLYLNTPEELIQHERKELGISRWHVVSEAMILSFAELSGDNHWVHTDPVRAARDTPFGGIIAHGFLTLALITSLSHECYSIAGAKRWLNYGLDKVRFTHPVKANDRVRLRATLKEAVSQEKGRTRITLGCALEIDGSDRPALVADWTMIAFD
jgi:acyl dehydratase